MPLDLKNIKYTSKAKVREILQDYKNKMKKKNLKTKLILCHGKEHKPKFSNAITLDIREIVNPDLVLNGWKEEEMKKIPSNFFNIIYLQHCPLGNSFNPRHNILWKNLKRILTKDGEIRSYSILSLYLTHKNKEEFFKKFKVNNFLELTEKQKEEYNKFQLKELKNNDTITKLKKLIPDVNEEFKKIGFKNVSHRKVYKYEKNYINYKNKDNKMMNDIKNRMFDKLMTIIKK